MRNSILVLLLTGMFLASSAQSGDPLRLEIPVRAGNNPFNYVPFGEHGICLFYPTINDAGKDSVSWSFVMLDKNLKEQWRKLIPLHEDVSFIKSQSTREVIYLLFHDTQRNTDGNIHVFFILPQRQIITQHRSAIPDKAEIVDFEIFNEFALIGYNQRKGKPGLLGFSLMNGEKRNFDFEVEENSLLLDVSVDTVYKDIYAVYKQQPSANRNNLLVNMYNSSSALRRTIEFNDIQEKRIIHSAQFISTGENKGMIAGTYGSGSRGRRNYDYFDDYYNYYYYNSFYRRPSFQDRNQDKTPVSDGYFSAVVTEESKGKIQYFNFVEFTNVQKYITNPDAIRAKRRAERKSQENAEADVSSNVSLDFRLIAHPLRYHNGDFLLLAEAYEPEYHTMTQMVYDYYGRAIPSTYSVFDGYRYTNAFLAAFDSSGRMKWNNGMEMRDILTNYLNRKMNFYPDQEDLVLFYNANAKIAFKTIRKDVIVDATSFTPIAPKRLTDQYVSEYLGEILPWYADYFLVSGYETVRNNNLEENKRNVFYLSKMAFR